MSNVCMRKTTDLESVKEIARCFLYMNIEETDYSPMIINHPIFESAFVQVERSAFPINILENKENLKRAMDCVEQLIDKATSVFDVYIRIRSSYRYAFFKHIRSFLNEEDYGKLLCSVWTGSENPNQDINVSVRESVRYFKKANKKYVMDKSEREYLKSLPEELKVYRGVSVGRESRGLSFTDSREMADWFAHRFDREGQQGYILVGTVKQESILAYFAGEHELVIDPRDIEGLHKEGE